MAARLLQTGIILSTGGHGVPPLQLLPILSALVSAMPLPYPATQPYEKLLIRLGKSVFLGSGKATTREKRRITAALRVLELRTASPRGHSEETVLLP